MKKENKMSKGQNLRAKGKKLRAKGKKWFGSLLRRRILVIVFLLLQIFFIGYYLIAHTMASEIIRNILFVFSIAVVIHVISKNDVGAYRLIWVFLILLFPVLGGILYVMVRFQSSTKRFEQSTIETEAKRFKYLTLCENDHEKALKEMPDCKNQINYLQHYAGFPIYGNTTAEYFPSGEDKLECLLEELEKAEHYIFLEYFIVQEGKMWDSILDVLKRKAAAGVKVKFIYDDFGCFFLLPNNYPKQLKKYGIECAVFNPFRPILSVVQNNRDHRKIISIDGKVCFTGGVNLADEYINEIEKYGHWKDSAIMITGKAAWSFTLVFLQMWEMCSGSNENYSDYFPWKEEKCVTGTDGFVQPYANSPLDDKSIAEGVYLQIINNAKKYIYITTPYLIIDDNMFTALTLAAESGVDVRIITPHKWDKFLVHMTTRSYYHDLISAGIRIYEYSKGFIHSKNFVSDDHTATVGTINLDYRSLYLHFECGVQLYDNQAITAIKKDFLDTLEVCHEITAEETKKNIFIQIIQDILRMFAPLM